MVGSQGHSPLPSVSVVIPCRNESEFIENCLRTVLQQNPGVSYEVIVADGMSTDGTREILRDVQKREPQIRIIDNPRQIASTALNCAVACARGRIIVRIDVHTIYPSDYLAQCIETVQQDNVWTVGGPQVATSDTRLGRTIAATYQSAYAVGGAKCHFADYEGPVDHVYLGCWKREAFNNVGGFDTALIRNQDVELDLRVADAGGGLWQTPAIQSRYHVRRSLQALARQNMQFGYWKFQVVRRHPRQFKVRHLLPAIFIVAVTCLVLAGLFSETGLYALLGLIGLYLAFVVVGTIAIARVERPGVAMLTPFVLPCYHFGYGYGFLHGLAAFIIGRRGAMARFGKLTR